MMRKLARQIQAAIGGKGKLPATAMDTALPPMPPVMPAADSPGRTPAGQGLQPVTDRDRASLLDDGIEGGHRLSYPDAAADFVTHLQAINETGEIARPRLEMLYAHHCAEAGLAMLPLNYFFEALAAVAHRHQRRVWRRDGYRQRVTTYDIPSRPVTAPAVEAAPIKHWRAA